MEDLPSGLGGRGRYPTTPDLIEDPSMADDFGKHLRDNIDAVNPNNVPIAACGIAWYRPETYDQCLAIFDDAEKLHDTYAEWLEAAERTEKQVSAQGMKVVRVDIDPVEFPEWCAAEEFKTIDQHARTHYGNIMAEKAARKNRK